MRKLGTIAAVLLLSTTACSFPGNSYDPGAQDALNIELGSIPAEVSAVIQTGSAPAPAQRRSVSEEESGKVLPLSAFRSFAAHQGSINSLDTSLNGLRVYTGGEDGKVLEHELFRAEDGATQLRTTLIYESSEPIFAVSLNPDGRLLAVAQNSLVFVIDTQSRTIIHRLSRASGRVGALTWDPKGSLLAIGRSNGEVLVWRIKSGPSAGEDDEDAIESYRGFGSPIIAIAFHPNGRVFFAAHRDGVVYLWRLIRTELEMGVRDEDALRDNNNRGRRNLAISGFNSRLEDIWMREDGKFLLVAASDGRILKVKIRGLLISETSRVGTDVVNAVRTLYVDREELSARESGATGVIAANYRDRQIRFWCLESLEKQLVASSRPLADPAEELAVAPGRSYLWAGQKSGNLLAFDADFLLKSPNLSIELQGCSRLVLNEAG